MDKSIELFVMRCRSKADCQLEALVKTDLNIIRYLDIRIFKSERNTDHLIETVVLQEFLSIF